MIAQPTRNVSITNVPTNVRKTPAFANDPAAYPVTFSVLRYASGGDTLEVLGSNPFPRGSLTFNSNPVNGETVAVNGVTFTFVTGASTSTNVHIGDSLEETLLNFIGVLNASANGSITPMTFSVGPAPNIVAIKADTPGTTGNAYTLANSSSGAVTRSAATLAGGQAYGDGQTIDAGVDFNSADQSVALYVVASAAGPTSLRVTDYTA